MDHLACHKCGNLSGGTAWWWDTRLWAHTAAGPVCPVCLKAEEEKAKPAYCRACTWRGFASTSDCPNCGAVALVGTTYASARDAEEEREYNRKRAANFNAVADGFAPPYPSEY